MRKSRLYLLPVFKIEQMITLERQGNIYMQISTISEGHFPKEYIYQWDDHEIYLHTGTLKLLN
jgi:hypothetical protein